MCSCTPSYNLQQLSSRLITSPGAIQIERGRKDRSLEISASFSNNLDNRTIPGTDRGFFDLESHPRGENILNCSYTTATRQADLYLAFIGRKLVCGMLESQLGLIQDKMYCNFSTGIGARLYRKNLAGRIWGSVGIAKARCDAYVLEQVERSIVFDLKDSYDDNLPFAGITFAFNTKSPALAVNPFVNMTVRYYTMFHYKGIAVSLVPVYLSSGIYKDIGPMTVSGGIQLNAYDINKFSSVHGALTGQVTWHLGMADDDD